MKQTLPRPASVMLLQFGLVTGIAVGLCVTALPVGILVAYWTNSQVATALLLAPQCLSILVTLAATSSIGTPIPVHNKAVEGVGNLIIHFLLGVLVCFFALPVACLIFGAVVISAKTGNKSAIRRADAIIKKFTGADPGKVSHDE